MTATVWQALARRHSWYREMLTVRLLSSSELADLEEILERIERHRKRTDRHAARSLEHLEPPSPAQH